MHVRMDGGEAEIGPGDVVVARPRHDAWVVGEEPAVVYDFAGGMAQDYAKAKEYRLARGPEIRERRTKKARPAFADRALIIRVSDGT